MTLPAGFRLDSNVLVNDGPTDAAASRFAGTHAPALWSRQVLTDGRLRAVAVVPPVTGTGPEQFQSVHATAERVAARLGVGAVEVAVWWADAITHDGPAPLTRLTAGDLAVLLTGRALDAATMTSALAGLPDANVLMLSSGSAS
jgi:glutamate N-acetyltransferase / amino-acid N-acetyltransferase